VTESAPHRERPDVADRNQFRLLGERRFAPFFVTQFLC
jgi:hypothetical protein